MFQDIPLMVLLQKLPTHFIWLLRQHNYDKEMIMMYEENKQ